MLRKLVLAFLLGIVFFAVAILIMARGPDFSSFEQLKSPAFKSMPAQKMLVVETTGDPALSAGKAIGQLFKSWYSLQSEYGRFKKSAPRARWPGAENVPRELWVGRFGLPVPELVNRAPSIATAGGTIKSIELETWAYGDIAEILHIGPYSTEAEDVDRLRVFISSNGYAVIGDHEEEYLRGPGFFGPGNPKKYYTIIRYRIEKKPLSIPVDSTERDTAFSGKD